MDDIAFWAPTEHEALHAQQTLFTLLESHVFTINHDKCSVGKSYSFGKLTITDEGVSIREAKLDEILANRLLGTGYATKSQYSALKGKVQHFIQLLPPSGVLLINLLQQKINSVPLSHPWRREPLAMDAPIREAINTLLEHMRLDRDKSPQDQSTAVLIVDASSEFWGGKLYPGNGRLTVNLSGPHNTTTKQLKGQNTCEAEAVKKGVEKAHEVLVLQRNTKEPYALKVYSDNMAVVTDFRNPDNRNMNQVAFANRIFNTLDFCKENNIRLFINHNSGLANPADHLTRPNLTEEQAIRKAELQEENKEKNKLIRQKIQNKGISTGFGNNPL
eukprot:GHVR01143075.1.p1 GENE.GHVR01143075.1~~GHVR01143075.1.p1  ORF type:complete len:331 (-),score=40.53 GHVR01143075.1:689-1681(-)